MEHTSDVDGSKSVRQSSSKGLSAAFLVLLVIGAIGSVFHVMLAVVAMLIYGWIGYRQQRKHINLDQFADSLYYMGFLFTLWALLISIGPFNAAPKENLINNVGMALLTTLIGLGARVVIIQLRPSMSDPVEIEKSIETAAGMLEKQLKKAVSQLTKSVTTMERKAAQMSSEIEKSKKNIAEGVKGIADDVSNIEIPSDVFKKSFENANNIIENAASDLGKVIGEGSNAIQKALSAISTDLELVRKSGETFAETTGKLQSLVEEAETLQGSFNQNSSRLSNEMVLVDKKIESLAVAVKRFDHSMAELVRDLGSARADVSVINKSVLDVADFLRNELNEPQ